MVRGDQAGAAVRKNCRDDSGDTFIDRLNRRDAGSNYPRMSDHVRICEIQDDQVEVRNPRQNFIRDLPPFWL
jgi:hypothetical protein